MSDKKNIKGSALVLGGGIAGIQASLDLADAEFKVYLVDSSPAIGGIMSKLDKTFPTGDCSICMLSPKLVECGRHHNIQIISCAQLEEVSGEAGNFTCRLSIKPRFINLDKCTSCGICSEHCPVSAVNLYNQGLNSRRAIFISYAQAIPQAYLIDEDKCIGCGLCQKICLAGAINYSEKSRVLNLHVGSIILCPGVEIFDATLKTEYGYKRYENVVTSLDFERMLSASGPYEGEILRPSDGRIPKKIGFIQCVGSREINPPNNFCSAVCCMYATKEAIIAKEHLPEAEVSVFYMDARAYGKGFDRYYERAKDEYRINYIRSNISGLVELKKSENILLRYVNEQGELKEEEFDLIILSVGLRPSPSGIKVIKKMDLKINQFGFPETEIFHPVNTKSEGIFICGTFQGPKDIPETVVQASASAAEASTIIFPSRGQEIEAKKYREETDVREIEPKIGVFVCHCGINIASVVDVSEVARYALTLDNVVYTENILYACSQDAQEKMKQIIAEYELNRVVVASCTPRTHEPLFQETLKEAGLNPYLFEMANIREQCSWVHAKEPENATEKAKELVSMAVAKARLVEPLKLIPLEVNQKGVVIGGGLSGLVAALTLAHQNYQVYLIEKEKELGGNLRKIYYLLEEDNVQNKLKTLIREVENNKNIQIYKEANIKKISGYVGNFTTELNFNHRELHLQHGIIIVATGGKEYISTEYLYHENEKVLTQIQLEEKITRNGIDFSKMQCLVMIQCVGSRNDEHPYCSRVCCGHAVKNTLKIKQINPHLEVYILYRDMRTYGFKEEYYQQARERGVIFIRYDDDKKPELENKDGLAIRVYEPILKEEINLKPDLVILSTGIIPHPENKSLSEILKVPLSEDGFFAEAHVKLRPVDFANEGIFLCGLAHSPKYIEENIAQAKGAVGRAGRILARDHLEVGGVVAVVGEEKCAACLTCVRVCPYRVPYINEDGVAVIEAARCQGCGICVGECPAKAIQLQGYKDIQIEAMCDSLFQESG